MARPGSKESVKEKYGHLSLEEKIASCAHLKPYGQAVRLRTLGVPVEQLPEEAREAYHARVQRLLDNQHKGPPARKAIIDWEKRIESIVRMELDDGKSQAEIAAELNLSPKSLYEYKKVYRALFKDAYTRRMEDAKTQHLAGYLRGRKKLAGLMGPAVDRLEKEIVTGESAGVATRAALGVAKLVLDQDKGGGTAFLLDDDSRVLWERVKTEDPFVDAEIIEPDALPAKT